MILIKLLWVYNRKLRDCFCADLRFVEYEKDNRNSLAQGMHGGFCGLRLDIRTTIFLLGIEW